MIVATLEVWQDDGPVKEFDKEFPSEEHLRLWLREQKQQMGYPHMWYILLGTTEVE